MNREKSASLRILWLARAIPLPLNAGDRIYTANLAGALAEQAVELTFLGLKPNGEYKLAALSENVQWRTIDAEPAPQWRFLLGKSSMAGARSFVPAYRDAVAACLEQHWDAVILDHYAMTWCIDYLRARNFRGTVVHIAHDFETHVTRDLAETFSGNPIKKRLLEENSRRVANSEKALIDACELIVTLTDRDATLFREAGFVGQTLILPPGYNGPVCHSRVISSSTPRRMIAVGSFEWTAKQINLERFLEAATGQLADQKIELRIIGKVPDAILARLRSRYPTVEFAGFVDSLAHEFDNARGALVFDETGGGFKLKMLDYIFCRVPIFGLTNALEGLPQSVLQQTANSSDLKGLVASIVARIDDLDLLNSMQANAADLVADTFSWTTNGVQFYEALSGLAERKLKAT